MINKRRVHYVLATHWDREVSESFQEMRYLLVRVLDRVIAGLEEGRLKGPFQTDGQSVLIEDYLEIRPDRRDQVSQLARQRGLLIGPWYTMPDEFTVSGESLIRNLQMGRDLARTLGAEPSNAGFVCDMFGHNSQLPQIFAGFGIPGAFIWRGTNLLNKRNLLWCGADGTLIPCYRWGPWGYGDYAFKVRKGNEFNDKAYDPELFIERFDKYVDNEASATEVDPVLILDSCDQQEWDQKAYALVIERMTRKDSPYEVVHSSLDDYLAEMIPQANRISTLLEGELREPGSDISKLRQDTLEQDMQCMIPGVLSSRYWLKEANRTCETLLCQWAEPFSTFMNLALGSEYPQGFLDLAWRNLLKNHAHDSIAGCVSDQVNRDIMYRFDQSRLVSSRLVKEATCQLAASIEGDLGDDEFRVVVFNPLPRPIDQVVEIILQIPPAWPTFNEFFGYEPKSAFHIYGLDEKELLYQRLNQTINRTKTRVRGTKFTEVYNTNDVAVALQLSIPAMGYTTLTVRAGFQGEPTRHPIEVSLATSECSMANEFMEVTIESNGSLTILDKQTGQVYHRLMTFEDSADIGDGWFHGSPVADKIFVSTACKSDIVLVQNGPELTTFEVRTIMSVPEEFHFDRMTRSDRLVEMVIQSQISLRSNQDFIEVRTIVDNPANDHRLRVLFPSGVKAATYLADTPFDVVERSIPLRRDNHLYRELEVETKPQQSWTAVFEAHRGLAVIADALLETSVRDLPERPLALTLFRATRRTALPDGDRDGQMRGRMIFNYCILPFAGQPDRTRLCEMGHLISAGLQCAQLSKADQLIFRQQRHDLPLSASFLCLEGPAVITSVCEKHNRLEVRMFNPSEETIHARLLVNVQSTLIMSLEFYQMVNFESEALGAPEPINGAIELTLASKKIFTLQIIGSSGG